MPLPERTVTAKRNTPHSGSGEWWSGFDDNLNVTLARTVDLTAAKTSAVGAWVRATSRRTTTTSGEVSTDNGANWTRSARRSTALQCRPEVVGPLGLQGHVGPVPLPRRH